MASQKSSEKTQELVERLRSYLDAAPRGTAAGLAKELGVTRNRISKWTSGEIRPGLEQVLWGFVSCGRVLKFQGMPFLVRSAISLCPTIEQSFVVL